MSSDTAGACSIKHAEHHAVAFTLLAILKAQCMWQLWLHRRLLAIGETCTQYTNLTAYNHTGY